MVFRIFRLNIVARIILLSATILLFAYVVTQTIMYATATMLGLLFVIEIISLIRYVEKTNRTMTRFLQAIEFDDFTQSFGNVSAGRSFDELNEAFALVSARFRDIRLEKEESFRYLQIVVQHVGVGMVAFREDGEIELLNSAAKKILGLPRLSNIGDLANISPALLERIKMLNSGQRDLVTISINNELVQLSLLMSSLRMRQRQITLVSFQNIAAELNEKEMDAWQNLIRVLTHEIKNSLTPIASLAATIETLMAPLSVQSQPDQKENVSDIKDALGTIRSRAEGLHQFVNAYRNLTNLPAPEIEKILVTQVLDRVKALIGSQLDQGKISYRQSVDPIDLQITADSKMIEQVLINLLLNSLQAMQECDSGLIEVSAHTDETGRVIIKVSDNGPGIVESAIEKIFVPFFTTRKGGSGIGLSLSRQIMRRHRGELSVYSIPDQKTTFTMRF